MPIRPDMYTVIGIRPDGSECTPLEYPTLAEALKKLQDLIEADECEIAYGETEERGISMFVRYTVIPHQVAEVAAQATPKTAAAPRPPQPPRPPPHDPDKPSLRLVR